MIFIFIIIKRSGKKRLSLKMEAITEEEKEDQTTGEKAAQEALDIALNVINLNMLKIDCAPGLNEQQRKNAESCSTFVIEKPS